MKLALVLALALACRVLPAELAGGTRAPLRVASGHLLVSADADGHPLTLVVDTGASITAISTAAASRLGLAATGTTPVNGAVARTGVIRRLSIADADHADVRIAMVKLVAFDNRRYVDGVLGLDLLARHDIVIDPQRGVLGFHPRGAVARWNPAGMSRIQFERANHGLLILGVKLPGGVTIPGVLDLGSPTSYVNLAAAASVGQTGTTIERHRIAIGDLEIAVSSMIVEDLPLFARLGLSGPAMLLGSDVFRWRTLAIGFADQLLLVSR